MSCSIAPFPGREEIGNIVGLFQRHAEKNSAAFNRHHPGSHINDRPAVIAMFNIKECRIACHVFRIAALGDKRKRTPPMIWTGGVSFDYQNYPNSDGGHCTVINLQHVRSINPLVDVGGQDKRRAVAGCRRILTDYIK